ncbi:MAG: hypothetical protein KDA71_18370, partial [Planctomycetales bacterium]|nr:hypothetical protein [Planctomycetales bacterium]
HGAIVIRADRTYFASVDVRVESFQDLVVKLLTDSPDDLSECEIRVREPETKRYRNYGWDGYALLK